MLQAVWHHPEDAGALKTVRSSGYLFSPEEASTGPERK